MISSSELAQIRSDAAAIVLNLSCQVQRKTKTPNSSGQPTVSWTTIATVNAGMSQPSASQLQNYDYLIGSLAAWQVRLPYGTDVKAQDQLVVAGQTLTVQAVLSPSSYAALLTVLASEVK